MAAADVQQTLAAEGLEQIVFVMRHGEKPEEGHENEHGDEIDGNICESSLMPRGWQRAGALVNLFTKSSRKGFAVPGVLSSPAYKKDPHGSLNHRTYQTIRPLGEVLELDTITKYEEGEEEKQAEWVRGLAGQIVLVCWEHSHIPALAKYLAPNLVIPEPWPSECFDVVWRFARAAGGEYSFEQLFELLLYGDNEKPIKSS